MSIECFGTRITPNVTVIDQDKERARQEEAERLAASAAAEFAPLAEAVMEQSRSAKQAADDIQVWHT